MKQKLFLLRLIVLVFGVVACQEIYKPKAKNQSMNTEYYSLKNREKVERTEEEWAKDLSPELYYIARQKGTERPFTGRYNDFNEKGDYHCAACGNHLFKSDQKFASSCGWPSFFEADKKGVIYRRDQSHGMERVEVLCQRCEAHLGHIFPDGPPPTGARYCMNSISLTFVPEEKRDEK